jgi:hypothetical protein
VGLALRTARQTESPETYSRQEHEECGIKEQQGQQKCVERNN